MKKETGIYVGIHWEETTKKDIKNLCDILKVPNQVKLDDIHSTIIYSTSPGKIVSGKTFHGARPDKLHYFVTKSQEDLDENWGKK